MKYTTYNVQQIVREGRKGKPWQARAKYKDTNGKWKEVSKMLPEAKGKKEAMRMAKEWFERKQQVLRGEITWDEYREWKLNWPDTSDVYYGDQHRKEWRKKE